MPIDAYANSVHYLAHLAPVWFALGRDRGTFYVTPDIAAAADRLALPGVTTEHPVPVWPDNPILVSASGNLNHVKTHGRTHAAIMEHGCGLSYGGGTGPFDAPARLSSSYAGGDGRPADLFLHPGEHPAARDRARYPDARVEVVGCPKLDTLPARVSDGIPTVAISFHWDTKISPETRSTFIYYRDHLALLAANARKTGRFRLIGHGHPRIYDRLVPWYDRKLIPHVRDFEDVCRMADVYAVDNSSTLYEFASTGRPVIVLNAPFYRKGVHHGLRFWEAANVGPQVDQPEDLEAAMINVLENPHDWDGARERAVDKVYAYRTGAAERAAAVLRDWAAGL